MNKNMRHHNRAINHTLERIEERYNVTAPQKEMWRDALNSIKSGKSIIIGTFKGRRKPMSIHAVKTSTGLMFFLYDRKRIQTALPICHPYLKALQEILSSRKRLHPRNRKLLEETQELLETAEPIQLHKFQPATPERKQHASEAQQTRRDPQEPQLE